MPTNHLPPDGSKRFVVALLSLKPLLTMKTPGKNPISAIARSDRKTNQNAQTIQLSFFLFGCVQKFSTRRLHLHVDA